jgi:glycine/D-amino acid oxidase-like deaminating enzyme
MAAHLRLDTPLWLDRRPVGRRIRFPPLRRRLDVDVAIVGGGITGAITAWRFAQAGVRVAVLEAGRIGRGSTAASTALLMQEPDEDFGALARRYGGRRTRRIWELSRTATRDLVRTLRHLEIRCQLVLRDSVYYGLTQESVAPLRLELRRRLAAGVRARWLDSARLARTTGIAGSCGIRTPGDAQVDPYLACLGFMDRATDSGAEIFERSQVVRVDTSRAGVTLTTKRGTVRADRVVVATGYATPDFEPLEARFRMLHTYVVATRRLRAAERRQLGLGPVMLWDTERPYHYARWTEDGRLLLGGADRPRVDRRRRRRALREGTRAVADYFVSLYPQLRDVTFEYGWEGLFATTPDSLPYIGPHRSYPRHLFALGYGGNGMTLGFLAAGLLLELYRGHRTSDHDLFAFNRKPHT